MDIKKEKVGKTVAVKTLSDFSIFEWDGKLFVKLRNRNKNICDIWNMEEKEPDWLMPSSEVRSVGLLNKEIAETGVCMPFGSYPVGEIFEKNGKEYLKAYPSWTELEEGALNAYDISQSEFVHFEKDEYVLELSSSYTVVMAES